MHLQCDAFYCNANYDQIKAPKPNRQIGLIFLCLSRLSGKSQLFLAHMCLIFATDERTSCREWPFICQFPLLLYLLLTRINGLPAPNHHMKGLSRCNYMLIGRKNQAKFENGCVLRNGCKIKITQPISMILVSFSSVEDALFSLQSTKNQPFCFFGGTPSICYSVTAPSPLGRYY